LNGGHGVTALPLLNNGQSKTRDYHHAKLPFQSRKYYSSLIAINITYLLAKLHLYGKLLKECTLITAQISNLSYFK